MGNARAAIERVGVSTTLSENPELEAMAAICAILRDLSDDERLRVMRWAFARFSPEFKRPLPEPVASPAQTSAASPETAGETPSAPAAAPSSDFGRQISELEDLFPARVGPQRRPGDPRKILEFV